MYYIHTREDMVRIPPDRLGEDLGKLTLELARQVFEGLMGPDQKLVVLITKLKLNGASRVVHGDGAVYQPVRMLMLLFDIRRSPASTLKPQTPPRRPPRHQWRAAAQTRRCRCCARH